MDYNLSYIMKTKSKKLIQYSNQLNNIKHELKNSSKWFIYLVIFCSLGLFCLGNFSQHLQDIISFSNASTKLVAKDYFLLSALIISGLVFLFYYFKKIKLLRKEKIVKENYTKLRLDIIDNINHDFCKCNSKCNCKDLYVKSMKNQYNIDLIFK